MTSSKPASPVNDSQIEQIMSHDIVLRFHLTLDDAAIRSDQTDG